MTKEQSCLFRYYDFADRCDDDIDVMKRAIKRFCDINNIRVRGELIRPNKILSFLANYTMEDKRIYFYDEIIKQITDADIARETANLFDGEYYE